MKITIDYSVLNDRPLQKGCSITRRKVIADRSVHDGDRPGELPQQHIGFFVPDDSDAARTLCGLLGLTLPT
jgi:hypothetical protein